MKDGSILMPKTVGGLTEPEQSLRSPWLKRSNSMDSIGTQRVKETHQLLCPNHKGFRDMGQMGGFVGIRELLGEYGQWTV